MRAYLRQLAVKILVSPTYIYLLNRLYQKGIQANLNFIETESGCFQGESYEDLLASVEFSLGELSEKKNKV